MALDKFKADNNFAFTHGTSLTYKSLNYQGLVHWNSDVLNPWHWALEHRVHNQLSRGVYLLQNERPIPRNTI